MKIIELLSERIDEELCDAKFYIKKAIEHKAEHRALADTFYTISTQEMGHVDMLHEQVVNLINQYKTANGNPPPEMMTLYDYLHKKQIEKANEVKVYQGMYKTA